MIQLAVLLHNATREDLGLDSSIRIHSFSEDDGEPVYDIDVEDGHGNTRTFRTVRIVSDFGADGLQCRGTRVCVVREVVNGVLSELEYILKDSWVNKTDPDKLEGAALKIIYDYLALPATEAVYRKCRENFLTVVAEGSPLNSDTHYMEGRLDLDNVKKTTIGLIAPSSRLPAGNAQNSSGLIPFLLAVPRTSAPRRQHYRLVFKEIRTASKYIQNPRKAFKAIDGAYQGKCIFLVL